MRKKIDKLLTRRNLLIILFVAFVFLRISVSHDSVLLGSDHLKFMELSKRFPEHTLGNNQLYLHHAPIYPYTIHFFSLIFQNTYVSSVLLSLVAAIITFFILYKFMMLLTGNFYISFLTLFFYAISVEFIIASREPLRESFTVMLLITSIYLYVKGVKENNLKFIAAASTFGAITAIATDHVIFLFPAFALSYLFFNYKKIDFLRFKFPNLHYALIPVVVTLLFYGAWFAVKAYQYSSYEYYPSGYEGTPVKTENFGFPQLLDPHNFEDYTTRGGLTFDTKNLVYNAGYMFNIEPFDIPRGLNFTTMKFLLKPINIVYMLVIYIPLAIITAIGFFYIARDILKNRKVYQNTNLYLFLLFLLFAAPIFYGAASPRYIYPAYLFLFFVIALGIFYFFKKLEVTYLNRRISLFVLAFILILLPIWAIYNNNFILSSEVQYGAQNTADYINSNLTENEVIMVQPGYAYKLIYLTDNKIIGLYPEQENFFDVIDFYNVSYIIVGRYYTEDAYNLARNSVQYVKNSPDKFELVNTVYENYSEFFLEEDPASSDEVYVYRVISRN